MDEQRGSPGSPENVLPLRPIERLTIPFERFLHVQSASGFLLFGCAILALSFANSRFAPEYEAFWNIPVRILFGEFGLEHPLWHWINDGLMTLFFFLIGLEIKRELVEGELSDRSKIAVPIAAAFGGALVPVLVFLALQHGRPGSTAWAVPMATDIAFVVGCLALLGRRVPAGLKVFMLTLAIVDDILAILVIAVVYAGGIAILPLAGAIVGFGIVVLLNRLGVRAVSAYVVVGLGIWLCTLKSGVHPTVAGVALGLLTPAGSWLGHRSLVEVLTRSASTIEQAPPEHPDPEAARKAAIETTRFASREAESPRARLEARLHPWVGFAIMPIFALANAGVAINPEILGSRLALAVTLGLVLGKPTGILVASFLVAKLARSTLPQGTNFRVILAGGFLAGIGFTMSLFVATLDLEGELLNQAKGGVLLGSAISLVVGLGLLHLLLPSGSEQPDESSANSTRTSEHKVS